MSPLLALAISGEHFAILVLIFLLCVFVGGWLFRKDTAQEARRKGYIKVAALLREYGFVRLPKLAESLAVGDYSDVAHQVKELSELAGNDAQSKAEVLGVLRKGISKVAEDPVLRAEFLSILTGVANAQRAAAAASLTSPGTGS